MRKFISLIILVVFSSIFITCTTNIDDEILNFNPEEIENKNSLIQHRKGASEIPDEENVSTTPFQVTFEPGTSKPERIAARVRFFNDPYTKLISVAECPQPSDKEIWYIEIHPGFAPPCGFPPPCGGPKKPAVHIEDDGSDLTVDGGIDVIKKAVPGVSYCDSNL